MADDMDSHEGRCANFTPMGLAPARSTGSGVNEVLRWILGLAFSLVLGAYGYAYSIGAAARDDRMELEARITRQLDIIEHKVDRVLEQQYLDNKRPR